MDTPMISTTTTIGGMSGIGNSTTRAAMRRQQLINGVLGDFQAALQVHSNYNLSLFVDDMNL
jgi:hypothetical protein